MPLYNNSVIYKLKRNDDYDDNNMYLGSTTNFRVRKISHKTCCNNESTKSYNRLVYKYIRDNGGWNEWVMIPVEEYPCNSKKELEIRERYHIDLLKPTLNKNIPTRTLKEYYKQNKDNFKEYYEQNKDKIAEYYNEYNKQNKDKVLKQKKEYYEQNKDNFKEKVKCEKCGCEVRKGDLKRHQKTQKCINFISNISLGSIG